MLFASALALLTSACQPGAAPPSDARGESPREAVASPASDSPGASPLAAEHSLSHVDGHGAVQPGAATDSGRTDLPATSGSADASPIDPANRMFRVELSRSCVTRGDLLVVRLEGPPRAGISMVIGFSDNQAHGALFTGESDDAGRFDWHVPIAPTVPPGPAKLLASSTGPDWEREGGGSAQEAFTVAEERC